VSGVPNAATAVDVDQIVTRYSGLTPLEQIHLQESAMRTLEILEAKKTEIDELCRRFCVKRLRLFGSALTAEWDEQKSDFDFLVEYTPGS